MTLTGAFFFGPLTLLALLLGGVPLTVENFPLYVAGGLGTTLWTAAASVVGSLVS
jgi:hypothetical protein